MRHQPLKRLRQRLYGPEERSLGVQRLARVGAERRRDAQGRAVGVARDERRAGGIPCRVAARLEGRAQAAGRKRRRVGFAADQVLAAERLQGLRRACGIEEAVVLLGGTACKRLEPVGEMRRPHLHGPTTHAFGHRIRDGRIERLMVARHRQQLRGDGLWQIAADGLLVKDVLAVGRQRLVRRKIHRRSLRQECGHGIYGVYAVVRAHGFIAHIGKGVSTGYRPVASPAKASRPSRRAARGIPRPAAAGRS